jgi:predicted DNA-binding transcriptional regulator YafY
MRADRLLSILLLLQIHGRMTTRELAERLGVTARTIHRDMGALSVAGVPVVADRGAAGGWSLIEEYQTRLTGLNTPEVQALALTRPPQVLADLGLEQASDAAFIKLLAALPKLGRRDAEDMRQRIFVDMTGWKSFSEETPCLNTVQDALWTDRRLKVNYQRNDGETRERTVDPLGLVAKLNIWYLVAAVDGEPRTYRVSRMQSAEIVDEPVRRPAKFDLPAFWQQSTSDFKASLPRYAARLRVDPGYLERLRFPARYARVESVSEADPPDPQGWQIVAMNFENENDAVEAALSFGDRAEVLDPPELRARVIEMAGRVVMFYQNRRQTI